MSEVEHEGMTNRRFRLRRERRPRLEDTLVNNQMEYFDLYAGQLLMDDESKTPPTLLRRPAYYISEDSDDGYTAYEELWYEQEQELREE